MKRSELMKRIDLQEDIPSICAQKLKYGQVEIALVPVALLAELPEYHILTDKCIGADGKVDSVKLYSCVPMEKISRIVLDYQSRTSVALTRLLCREYWKIQPLFTEALPGFEENIKEDTAAVVIGDRTFPMNGKFQFEYDLSEEWKKMTGLPFVFAVWVSREKQDKGLVREFSDILQMGLDNIDLSVSESTISSEKTEEIKKYLKQKISYQLDSRKLEGMALFLNKIRKL